jgi:glycosyltransferase involved in cell wall biosynthesis
MQLSIIIPLYNEEQLIIELLDQLSKVRYPDFVKSTQIVVVDDRSTDNSYKNVEQYISREASNIQLLRQDKNRGKGAAVRTGIDKSSGDIILIQDADLELSPSDIPSLLNAMHELKIPFVNGSRYLPGVLRTQASFKRYFANKFFTFLASLFIDIHLTDMACGYKLFTRELYEKLNLKENRFGFEAELIIKSGRLQRNWITEIPVKYSPRNAGEGKKLRNLDGLRILKVIVKYGLFRAK